MRTLAARANFSPSFISQVENGQAGFFSAPQQDGGRVIRSAAHWN